MESRWDLAKLTVILGLAVLLVLRFPVLLTGIALTTFAILGWAQSEERRKSLLLIILAVATVLIYDLQFNGARIVSGTVVPVVEAWDDTREPGSAAEMR